MKPERSIIGKGIAFALMMIVIGLGLVSCDLEKDVVPDDTSGLVLSSTVANQGLTFYPDGYGNLSYVTYYPQSFTDNSKLCWSKNSAGSYYTGMTWSYTKDSSSQATLRISYREVAAKNTPC